jgi:hypothetical protein
MLIFDEGRRDSGPGLRKEGVAGVTLRAGGVMLVPVGRRVA